LKQVVDYFNPDGKIKEGKDGWEGRKGRMEGKGKWVFTFHASRITFHALISR
jgi:hypothetical protein